MATMTALKFPTVDGARKALAKVSDLQTQHLLVLHDAAIVEWPEGKNKPRTEQMQSPAGSGALSGAFWGLLFGLLFFVPLLGAALGALAGGLAGSLVDVGVNDDFIRRVREQVTPGTSALFLLTSQEVTDRVVEAFGGTDVELVASNLSREQEDRLRQAFEADEGASAMQAG